MITETLISVKPAIHVSATIRPTTGHQFSEFQAIRVKCALWNIFVEDACSCHPKFFSQTRNVFIYVVFPQTKTILHICAFASQFMPYSERAFRLFLCHIYILAAISDRSLDCKNGLVKFQSG